MRHGAGSGVLRAAVVVGREVELNRLRRAVRDARSGAAGCVLLVGEGGVGKTRLLAEVAAEARRLGIAVLAGRAPITAPVAFSVVAEALRSWLRGHRAGPVGEPFDAGLRLVLPEWLSGTDPADNLSQPQRQLLALEGVVRLARAVAARSGGAVLLLDDLHAADPDSLEVVRYLASAASPGVLVIGALRSRESSPVEQIVRALRRDGVAEVLDVEPLGRREVTDLLRALLGGTPPDELVTDVVARTDGVPLLVEEVLHAHLRAGSVERGEHGARWRGGGPVVSRTIADMVGARLARLPSRSRDTVMVGAVLGDFEPTLLAAVAQQTNTAVGDAVAHGVDAGLLEVVGGAVGFRHAVIRDAVLTDALPHVLSAIHRRAADALTELVPSDAAGLERRAHHLAQVGEDAEAAALLTAAAVACLDQHAALPAEALARRALGLTESAASAPASAKASAPVSASSASASASDALARALAAQGRWTEALAVDEAAERTHGETPQRWYRMATSAVELGRPDLAGALLARAAAHGDTSAPRIVIAGRLAMTSGDAGGALESAELALTASQAADDVATMCAALDLQARALDYTGHRAEAARAWNRQADAAKEAGLIDARLRAVVMLGKLELFAGQPPQRLYEARELTRDAGALVEQAWAEENLAIALLIQGELEAGARIAAEAVQRCRELRLADLLPYLLCTQAGAVSFLGGESADALLDEAEALAPTADVRLQTCGLRASIALHAGRYAESVHWCETGVEIMRSLPGVAPSDCPCVLVWALAADGRSADAAQALRTAAAMPELARWYANPVLLATAAALLDGDEAGIDAAIASATGRMPLDLALVRVLAAEVLTGPARARWLREALDIYESTGAVAAIGRVRRLLREAGGPVPRHRRTAAGVPTELAAHGVTAREAEVLRLLGDGLPNAVIADRLYLSVRTIESHVSSLLAKLHLETRGQLTALSVAAAHRASSP